jgi:hypothetical protein
MLVLTFPDEPTAAALAAVRAFPPPPAPKRGGDFPPGLVADATNIHHMYGPHGAMDRAVASAAALGYSTKDVDRSGCDCATCAVANLRRVPTHGRSASAHADYGPAECFDFDLATDLKPTAVGGYEHALDGCCVATNYMYTAPVKAKDAQTILTELRMFVAALRAQGITVRVIRLNK